MHAVLTVQFQKHIALTFLHDFNKKILFLEFIGFYSFSGEVLKKVKRPVIWSKIPYFSGLKATDSIGHILDKVNKSTKYRGLVVFRLFNDLLLHIFMKDSKTKCAWDIAL